MPSIVSHVVLAVAYPEKAPDWATERWAEWLKANAEHIKESIQLRFPDDEQFQLRLAEPASKDYRDFVNPAYVSRAGVKGSGIVAGHLSNLKRSFPKYLRAITAAFPQWFKDRVDAAKEDFAKGIAARTLPFTGTKRGGRGVAPIAARWLTADPIATGLLRPSDEVLEGGPYLVCPREKMAGLKAMLNQRLIQAGATILKSGLVTAVITAENQQTAEQVQGFVDPTLGLVPFTAGGDSCVDFFVDANGQLYLRVKVSKM